MIWLQMVWYFRSRIKLINLSLIKSALLVSIPEFTISNLKHAKHYFQTTLNSVTLSAVGCTGCAHHNGPFLKRTNHKLHSAEFLHDSSGMLRRRHKIRMRIPRRVWWRWRSISLESWKILAERTAWLVCFKKGPLWWALPVTADCAQANGIWLCLKIMFGMF